MKFKVGDKVRVLEGGDTGIVSNVYTEDDELAVHLDVGGWQYFMPAHLKHVVEPVVVGLGDTVKVTYTGVVDRHYQGTQWSFETTSGDGIDFDTSRDTVELVKKVEAYKAGEIYRDANGSLWFRRASSQIPYFAWLFLSETGHHEVGKDDEPVRPLTRVITRGPEF